MLGAWPDGWPGAVHLGNPRGTESLKLSFSKNQTKPEVLQPLVFA